MAVTGWKSCGTVANDTGVGTLGWHLFNDAGALSGTEVSSDNGTYAGVYGNSSATTNYLKCTNFGFTTSDIPSGSTIDGIEVEYRKYRVGNPTVSATVVKLVKGGTIQGNDIAGDTDWATAETADVYGSSTEKGGLTIADTDVTASNFGAALSMTWAFTRLGGIGDNGVVDQVRMRVYYTEGDGTLNMSATATIGVTATGAATGGTPTTLKWASGNNLNLASVTTNAPDLVDGSAGDNSTYYQATGNANQYITAIYDLATASTVGRLRFRYGFKDTGSWNIYGSNDGTSWIDAWTGGMLPDDFPSCTFAWKDEINATTITTTQYRYWRLVVRDTNSGCTQPWDVRLGDFRLYDGSGNQYIPSFTTPPTNMAATATVSGTATATMVRVVSMSASAAIGVTSTAPMTVKKNLTGAATIAGAVSAVYSARVFASGSASIGVVATAPKATFPIRARYGRGANLNFSQCPYQANKVYDNTLDDTSTYISATGTNSCALSIVYDLGESRNVDAFYFNAYHHDGNFSNFNYSDDGTSWTEVTNEDLFGDGTFAWNSSGGEITPSSHRYWRLVVTDTVELFSPPCEVRVGDYRLLNDGVEYVPDEPIVQVFPNVSTIAVTASSAIHRVVPMTASATIAGTASATMLRKVYATGAATITGAATAALTNKVFMSGTSTVEGDASGVMTKKVPMSGTAAISVVGTAAYEVNVVDLNLAATATIGVAAEGAYTPTVPMSGTSTAVVFTSGNATVIKPISGAPSIGVTVSTTMTVVRPMSGNASIGVTAEAEATTKKNLAGAAEVGVISTAAASLILHLSASPTIQVNATIGATNAVFMAGAAEVGVTVGATMVRMVPMVRRRCR